MSMHPQFSSYHSTVIRTVALSVGLLLSLTSAFAQSANRLDREDVFLIVEKPPEFPGGRQAMYDYLKRTVQFPPAADSAKIQGKVLVSFIVQRDGQLANIELMNGLGYGCDEEAIRVVKAMPRWQAGTQSGREQNVIYKIQILFGIDYPKVKVR